MGRRKRRRLRLGPKGAAAQSAANDPDESFDLEVVDDRHDVPHPLEDVASALDTEGVDDATSRRPAAAPAKPIAGAAEQIAAAGDPAPGAATSSGLEASGPPPESPAAQGDADQHVQTLGELLQQARESRGLSVEETSARTRISLKMLGYLENDRYGEFAADAYAKGFLRNYGKFLGLDVDMLVRRYETISGRVTPAAPAVWEEVVEKPRARKRWKPKRRSVTGFAVIAVVATCAWVLWSRAGAKLRPTPGLQQIENQLRAAPEPRPRLEAGIAAPPTPDNEDRAVGTPDDASHVLGDSVASAAVLAPLTHEPAAAKPATKPAVKPAATKPATTPAVKPVATKRATKPRVESAPPKPVKPKPEDTQPPPPQPERPKERDATPPPPPPEPSDPPR
jgi:cytoskeleton protein RodZ